MSVKEQYPNLFKEGKYDHLKTFELVCMNDSKVIDKDTFIQHVLKNAEDLFTISTHVGAEYLQGYDALYYAPNKLSDKLDSIRKSNLERNLLGLLQQTISNKFTSFPDMAGLGDFHAQLLRVLNELEKRSSYRDFYEQNYSGGRYWQQYILEKSGDDLRSAIGVVKTNINDFIYQYERYLKHTVLAIDRNNPSYYQNHDFVADCGALQRLYGSIVISMCFSERIDCNLLAEFLSYAASKIQRQIVKNVENITKITDTLLGADGCETFFDKGIVFESTCALLHSRYIQDEGCPF